MTKRVILVVPLLLAVLVSGLMVWMPEAQAEVPALNLAPADSFITVEMAKTGEQTETVPIIHGIDEFYAKIDQMRWQNYVLTTHQTWLNDSGELTFTAVFTKQKTPAYQIVKLGLTQAEFAQKRSTLYSQGFVFHYHRIYRVGGNLLFDGLWEWPWFKFATLTDERISDTDLAGFLKFYQAGLKKNFWVVSLQAYDRGDGVARYDAILRKSSAGFSVGQFVEANLTPESFKAKSTTLAGCWLYKPRCQSPYWPVFVQRYNVPGQGPRYAAIWEASSPKPNVIESTNLDSQAELARFQNRLNDLKSQGYAAMYVKVIPSLCSIDPNNPISIRYKELRASGIDLGGALGCVENTNDGGSFRPFKNGSIYYSPKTKARVVQGDILKIYRSVNGPHGSLGYPVSDELLHFSGLRFSMFQNGNIVWDPNKGTSIQKTLLLPTTPSKDSSLTKLQGTDPNAQSTQNKECHQKWTRQQINEALNSAYQKILERNIDPSGLQTYWDHMCGTYNGGLFGLPIRGDWSLRKVINDLGNSDEYAQKFAWGKDAETVANLAYLHFLARPVESPAILNLQANDVRKHGHEKLIDDLTDSPEYRTRFGGWSVPGGYSLTAIPSNPQLVFRLNGNFLQYMNPDGGVIVKVVPPGVDDNHPIPYQLQSHPAGFDVGIPYTAGRPGEWKFTVVATGHYLDGSLAQVESPQYMVNWQQNYTTTTVILRFDYSGKGDGYISNESVTYQSN